MRINLLDKAKKLKNLGARYITTVAYLNPDTGDKVVVTHLFDLNGKLEELTYEAESSETLESIKEVYPAVEWSEREIMELYGIEFSGYPEEEKNLLLSSGGHPFPLLEVEKQKVSRKRHE
ncbi:NADH-quinone oxidoreductase subunit C [Thermodesulfobacterium sp.]|jgi:NADH-quinone oxidoreductase subunit C|uniref:NADH-quinone oxidoreductase subunit C n=1 Tax=Thermodesulfobacterium sp. TaxID=1965289 RepID=UPI002648D91C|nr:NADH-quinone oxidoreductase subunit C [Thermodesulfobacterium sp.]MDN5380487.1 NADH-quinone oxidoreductase subunit [Thermodesulfobacterium sp.]